MIPAEKSAEKKRQFETEKHFQKGNKKRSVKQFLKIPTVIDFIWRRLRVDLDFIYKSAVFGNLMPLNEKKSQIEEGKCRFQSAEWYSHRRIRRRFGSLAAENYTTDHGY